MVEFGSVSDMRVSTRFGFSVKVIWVILIMTVRGLFQGPELGLGLCVCQGVWGGEGYG